LSVTAVHAVEKYTIVTVSGFDRKKEYTMMTNEEIQMMKTELSQEGQYFSRALSAAKKQWSQDASKKGYRFPMLAKRTMRTTRSYTNQEDAMEKLKSYADPKSAKNRGSKNKAVDIDIKSQLEDEAIVLLKAQLIAISDGAVTCATHGIAANTKQTSTDKPFGVVVENCKFSLNATLYYNQKGRSLRIEPLPGERLLGKVLWGFVVPD
jgi:hypothetical protein